MEPMTIAGADSLRAELDRLIKVERPKVISAIAAARELGDLKENAEYHTAKDRQGMIEARILALENKLRSARIIDITKIPYSNRVMFGCTVTLRKGNSPKKIKYQIVGNDESDAAQQKISYTSPLAKSMISKAPGDKVELLLEGKAFHYKIEKIEHI